jgi:hypothetical protein
MALKKKTMDTFREDINFSTFLAFMNLYRRVLKSKQAQRTTQIQHKYNFLKKDLP